ncbi:hypothetical protein DPMN_154626, partial [Dreissena polymorpha]
MAFTKLLKVPVWGTSGLDYTTMILTDINCGSQHYPYHIKEELCPSNPHILIFTLFD